jgi:hypothetical protein
VHIYPLHKELLLWIEWISEIWILKFLLESWRAHRRGVWERNERQLCKGDCNRTRNRNTFECFSVLLTTPYIYGEIKGNSVYLPPKIKFKINSLDKKWEKNKSSFPCSDILLKCNLILSLLLIMKSAPRPLGAWTLHLFYYQIPRSSPIQLI